MGTDSWLREADAPMNAEKSRHSSSAILKFILWAVLCLGLVPSAHPDHESLLYNSICHEVGMDATQPNLVLEFWLESFPNQNDLDLLNLHSKSRNLSLFLDKSRASIRCEYEFSGMSKIRTEIRGLDRIPGWKHILIATDGADFRVFLNGRDVPRSLLGFSKRPGRMEYKNNSASDDAGCLEVNPLVIKSAADSTQNPRLSNLWIWQPSDLTKTYALPANLFSPEYQTYRHAAADNALLFTSFDSQIFDNFPDEIPIAHSELSGGVQKLELNIQGNPEQVFETTLILKGWPFARFHVPAGEVFETSFIALNENIDLVAYNGNQGIYQENIHIHHTDTGSLEAIPQSGIGVVIDVLAPFASQETRWVGEIQRNGSDRIAARILSNRDRTFQLPWIPDENFSLRIHDADKIITINLSEHLHNLNPTNNILTISQYLSSVKLSQPLLFSSLKKGNTLEKLTKAKHVLMDKLGGYIIIGSEKTGLVSVSHDEIRPIEIPDFDPTRRITCIQKYNEDEMFVGTTTGLHLLYLDEFGEIRRKSFESSEVFQGINIQSIVADSDGVIWVGTDRALYFKYGNSQKWNEFLLNNQSEGVRGLRNPTKGLLTGIGSRSGPFQARYNLNGTETKVESVTIVQDKLQNLSPHIQRAFSSGRINDYVHDHSAQTSLVAMPGMLIEIAGDWQLRPVLYETVEAMKPHHNGKKIILTTKSNCLSYSLGSYHEILDTNLLEESPDIYQFTLLDNYQIAFLTETGIFKLREGPVSKLYTDTATGKSGNHNHQFIESANQHGIYFVSRFEPHLCQFSQNRYTEVQDIPQSMRDILRQGVMAVSWSDRHKSLLIAGRAHLVQFTPETGHWRFGEYSPPGSEAGAGDNGQTELRQGIKLESLTLTADGDIIGHTEGENIWTRIEISDAEPSGTEGTTINLNYHRIDLPGNFGRIQCAYESKHHKVQAYGTNRGLFINVDGKWIKATMEDKAAFRFSVNHLAKETESSTSRLVVVTDFGLYRWDMTSKSPDLEKLDIIAPDARILYTLDSGQKIVWDSNCIATIARPEAGLKKLCDSSHPLYLGDGQSYIDSTQSVDGPIWVMTDSGIYKVVIPSNKPKPPALTQVIVSGDGLPSTRTVPDRGKIRITRDPDEYLIIDRPHNCQINWNAGNDTYRFRNIESDEWQRDIYKLDSQACIDLIRSGGQNRAEVVFQRFDSYLNISDDKIFNMEIWTPLWSRGWMKGLIVSLFLMSFTVTGTFWHQARQKRIDLQNQKLKSMTELRQSNVRLREAITKIKAAQESKDQFLATMSHEIRTPMNGIIGMTELLMDSGLNVEQKDFGRSIHSCAQSLLTIINDILDLSKIEAGKILIESTEFDIFELIEETAGLYRSVVRSKSIRLDIIVDETIPQYLLGDPTRIKQILNNFLNNAIKFTENGDVQLQARVLHRDEKFCKLILSVKDTGIGIPEHKLDTIFDSFSQVDASTTRKYGGTGLGLTICKKLTELMGGRILVESETGKGSTFSILVPFEISSRKADPIRRIKPPVEMAQEDQAGSAQQTEETPATSSASANPNEDCFSRSLEMAVEEVSELENSPEKKYLQDVSIDTIFDLPIASFDDQILVVEDNRINQRLLLKFLSKLNLKASVVQNGEEAVEAYYKTRYPIILMDCQMPIMDGYTATGKILEIAENLGQKPTIIALTANAMPSDRQKCLQAGMHDYLAKPITLTGLRETLEKNGVRIFHETGEK